MEVTGDVIMAWMLLWRATIAAPKLEKSIPEKDAAFYQGQLNSVDFFIHAMLPTTLGKMEAILNTSDAALKIPQEALG